MNAGYMTMQKQHIYFEIIKSSDGKNEDKFVLVSAISIIFAALFLLHFLYGRHEEHSPIIPKGLQQHLTTLSNAADEITMMGFNEQLPTLDELVSLEVEPFVPSLTLSSSHISWQQHDRCFVGLVNIGNEAFQLRLIFKDTSQSHIHWRPFENQSAVELCSSSPSWQDIIIRSTSNHAYSFN